MSQKKALSIWDNTLTSKAEQCPKGMAVRYELEGAEAMREGPATTSCATQRGTQDQPLPRLLPWGPGEVRQKDPEGSRGQVCTQMPSSLTSAAPALLQLPLPPLLRWG